MKPPTAQSSVASFKPSITAVDQMGQNKFSNFSAMGARSSSNSNLGGTSAASLRSPVRSQVGTKLEAGMSQFSASSAQNPISFSAKVGNPSNLNDASKNLETHSMLSDAKSIGQSSFQVNAVTSGIAAMKLNKNDGNTNIPAGAGIEQPTRPAQPASSAAAPLSFQPVSKYTRQLME